MLAGQGAEERLHQDFRFAEAGGEVILQAFQLLPAIAWCNRACCGDVLGGVIIFSSELLQSFRQNSQFLEITGAAGKENAVEEFVPRGRGLRSFTAEVLRIQRGDIGNVTDVPAAFGEYGSSGNE